MDIWVSEVTKLCDRDTFHRKHSSNNSSWWVYSTQNIQALQELSAWLLSYSEKNLITMASLCITFHHSFVTECYYNLTQKLGGKTVLLYLLYNKDWDWTNTTPQPYLKAALEDISPLLDHLVESSLGYLSVVLRDMLSCAWAEKR